MTRSTFFHKNILINRILIRSKISIFAPTSHLIHQQIGIERQAYEGNSVDEAIQ